MSDTVTGIGDSLDQAAAEAVAAAERFASEEGGDGRALAVTEVAFRVLSRLVHLDSAALSSEGLLALTGLLGNVGRLVEGRQVANVGEIARRSDTASGMGGLAAIHGASSPAGLFEKITGVKGSTARRYVNVAKHTSPRVTDAGLPLPPVFSQTGQALSEGLVGVDTAEALTSTLAPVLPRAVPDEVDQAEETLLGNATGAFGQAPVSADSLRVQARAFTVALDPDGAEPRAEELHQGRRLTLRNRADGSLAVAGLLSPEQAAVVNPVFDAFLSSRTGPGFIDTEERRDGGTGSEKRSRAQERADVFTAILGGMAKVGDLAEHGSMPKLHGRGPTVLVTVADEHVQSGVGAGWSPGTPEPLPVSFVTRAQCDGDTITVAMNNHGEVTGMSDPKRFFTNQQRLVLIARDGPTCIVDDCPIPAWLCEAHHIDGWAHGGTTTVSNGVLL